MPAEPENRPRSTAPLRLGNLENASKSKPFDPVEALWRSAPLILSLGIPLFVLLFLFLSLIIKPTFTAKGTILINQISEPNINGQMRELIAGDVATYQRTLAIRLTDTKLLAAAVKSLRDEEKPKFLQALKGNDNLAGLILSTKLTAIQVEGSYIINVILKGSAPKGLATTLQAVLKNMIRQLQAEQEDQYEKRLSYLRSEQKKLSDLLDETKGRISLVSEKYGDKAVFRTGYTADLIKIQDLQRVYYEAASEVLVKEALFNKAEKDRIDLEKLDVAPIAQEIVAGSLGVNMIEQYTYAQQQTLRSTIDGLTTNNLDRQKVEDNIQAMKDYQTSYRSNLDASTLKTQAAKKSLELESAVIKARNDYLSSKESLEKLKEDVDKAKQEVSQTSEGVFEANELNFVLKQYRDRLAAVNEAIREEELRSKAPLPVVIGETPQDSDRPDKSSTQKVFLLAFMASFGLLGGGSLASEFLSQIIQSRKELGAAVGGLGADPIPAMSSSGGNPGSISMMALRSGVPSEMPLRNLALRCILEHQRTGAKIFSFVGAHHRSGNTFIALNVARAISVHGFDVLLAELPTRHPGLARLAGIAPAREETTTPWAGKTFDPQSTVQLIPHVPGTSTNSVRSSMDSFLANATKICDFLILDLTPMSVSDVSNEAAVKSDVAVITAAQSVALYPDVRSAVEWIAGGGVPAITTVLNFEKPNYFRLRVMTYFKYIGSLLRKYKGKLRNRIAVAETHFASKVNDTPAYRRILNRISEFGSVGPEVSKNDDHSDGADPSDRHG